MSIFNSKFISFFINESFSVLGIDGGINFNKEIIESLPINESMIAAKDILIRKSKEVVKLINQKKDTSWIKAVIDILIYKLYFLTYDECKIIDPEIEQLISRNDYEKATIEELAEWEFK